MKMVTAAYYSWYSSTQGYRNVEWTSLVSLSHLRPFNIRFLVSNPDQVRVGVLYLRFLLPLAAIWVGRVGSHTRIRGYKAKFNGWLPHSDFPSQPVEHNRFCNYLKLTNCKNVLTMATSVCSSVSLSFHPTKNLRLRTWFLLDMLTGMLIIIPPDSVEISDCFKTTALSKPPWPETDLESTLMRLLLSLPRYITYSDNG